MATLQAMPSLVLLVLLALSGSTASARLLRSLGQDGGLAARHTGAANLESQLPSGTEPTGSPKGTPPGEDSSPTSPLTYPEDDRDKPLSPSADLPEGPAAPGEEQPAGGDSTTATDESTLLPEQQLEQQQESEQLPMDAEALEAEQEHVDASDVGVPTADLTAAAAFPDAPSDGEVAGTFDFSDAEDDAEFAAAGAAALSDDAAGAVGMVPPSDVSSSGGHGCHPHPPSNVHAYWADYDLYPPYSPKLKCPRGWYTAGDSDKQLVKGLLDDAFYRMVLPAINLDHSKRARAFKCQPGDVVSLHHHHVAGCIERGGTGRMIVQGDMEYVCWGSKREMTVGQKVEGNCW